MIDLLEPDDNSNKNKNITLDKNGVKENGNKKKKKFKCWKNKDLLFLLFKYQVIIFILIK